MYMFNMIFGTLLSSTLSIRLVELIWFPLPACLYCYLSNQLSTQSHQWDQRWSAEIGKAETEKWGTSKGRDEGNQWRERL